MKTLIVSGVRQTEGQGHLMSSSGQLKSRKSCHVINTQDLAEREVEAWPSPTVPQPLKPPTSVPQPQSPPSVPQPGPPTVCQPGGQVLPPILH